MKKNTLIVFFFFAVIVAGTYGVIYGGDKLGKFISSLTSGSFWLPDNDPLKGLYACRFKTIKYSIGNIDPGFDISSDEVSRALKEAEAIWETGTGKDLFNEVKPEAGSVSVNLVFDSRQKDTISLKGLTDSISSDEERFNALKAEYDKELATFKPIETEYLALTAKYEPLRKDLTETVSLYEKKRVLYETEVISWNNKGGPPKPIYDQLIKDKADLDTLYAQIKAKEESIKSTKDRLTAIIDPYNTSAGKLNTLGGILNRMAESLNSNIKRYNQFEGSKEEFVTGIYKTSGLSKEIDVYQFYDFDELVFILAHEMGHALNSGHASDPASIMYPVIGAQKKMATEEDISLIAKSCPK